MDQDLPAPDLSALEARVRHDLSIIAYPELDWVAPRTDSTGTRVLDVLIIGGGQGGLATAFGLMRERIANILVVDAKDPGAEGPWLDYARMQTLRSWKSVNGPDLDIPSLAFQSWYEAQHGAAAWAALGKISRQDWAAYLSWYRRVAGLPVLNGTRLIGIRPGPAGLEADLVGPDGPRTVTARKIVLATGIESPGRWWLRCWGRGHLPSTMPQPHSKPVPPWHSTAAGQSCSGCSRTSGFHSTASCATSTVCRTLSAGALCITS
jgi:hypothetical protein